MIERRLCSALRSVHRYRLIEQPKAHVFVGLLLLLFLLLLGLGLAAVTARSSAARGRCAAARAA
jgi:hypothetical protein